MHCSFCGKTGLGSDIAKCSECGAFVCGDCRIGDMCPTCHEANPREPEEEPEEEPEDPVVGS